MNARPAGLRACLIIYIPCWGRAPSLSLSIPVITDHATATIIIRSTKMSTDSTKAPYITVQSGQFRGQHCSPHDNDDATAKEYWLKSLDEDTRKAYQTAIASALEAHSTGVQLSEKPPSFPAEFHSEWVSNNFPYPFGKAGTAKRITAYLELRSRDPYDRKQALGDVQQRVAEWERERESGTQGTGLDNESDWEDVKAEEQGEGSTEQRTRQDTEDEEQRRVGSVEYQSSGPSRQHIEQGREGGEWRQRPGPESLSEVPPRYRRYLERFEYGSRT